MQYEPRELRRDRKPLVSVVTPAYNAARFISGAIESVQAQTYAGWEMIVVDDCSRDDTPALVEEKAGEDERVRLLRMAENGGAAIARNAAIGAARGRYIAFLDSDDLWLPTKLEEQLAFMRERDAAFSFTSYRRVDASGRVLGEPVPVPERMNYRDLLKNTAIGCLTVVLDRSKTGPLDMGSMRTRQDYVLWFKLLKSGMVAYGLQEDLARYRIVEGSISRNKTKAARTMWYLYRRVEGLNLPYAAWCFLNYASRAYLKGRK